MSSLSVCGLCNPVDQLIRGIEPDGTAIKIIANIPILADIILRIKYCQLSQEFDQHLAEFKNRPSLSSEHKSVKAFNDLVHLANNMTYWGLIQRIAMLVVTTIFAPPLIPAAIFSALTIYCVTNSMHCMFNAFMTNCKKGELTEAQLQFARPNRSIF